MPARWRGGAGSSPLDGASTAASSPRNDLVKNYRVHPTHWLISTQVTMAATLLGILSFLVALTIFFERTQEHMIHSSVPTMKPVVRQTFAEVTVLGFLSIVTTVAGKCGLWGLLAHVVYGEEVEEEEL